MTVYMTDWYLAVAVQFEMWKSAWSEKTLCTIRSAGLLSVLQNASLIFFFFFILKMDGGVIHEQQQS